MLYNVTVTAQTENEGLVLPAAAYLGNMEGGTSRRAELSLTPTKAGDFDATLLVTWEDALGEKFSDTRTVSFTAQADDTEDIWNTPVYDNTGYDFENEPQEGFDAGYFLELLPWWIYAAVAGLYLLIVIYIGASVRSRRRKALEDEDDEIE